MMSACQAKSVKMVSTFLSVIHHMTRNGGHLGCVHNLVFKGHHIIHWLRYVSTGTTME